jgi:conjugal transfer pilus assembly protein TraK
VKAVTIRALIGSISCAISFAAQALQVIEPVEGVNSFVKISAKEQTRIAVENGKLLSLIATEGELAVEKDSDRGQVFIRPVKLDKPINIRVIPSSGKTYSLVLQAVDIPQEDVVIRDPAAPKERAKEAAISSKNTEFKAAIKAVINAMTSDDPGIEKRDVNEELALWEGTRFVKRATYTDRFLTGDRYELFNVGKDPIRIVEQEFFVRGVVAVAVSSMLLPPGASTEIFIVREGVR